MADVAGYPQNPLQALFGGLFRPTPRAEPSRPRFKKRAVGGGPQTEEYLSEVSGKAIGVPWKETVGWLWAMNRKDIRAQKSFSLHFGPKKTEPTEDEFVKILTPEKLNNPELSEEYIRGIYRQQRGIQAAVRQGVDQQTLLEQAQDENLPIKDSKILRSVYEQEADRWAEETQRLGRHFGPPEGRYQVIIKQGDLSPKKWGRAIKREAKSVVAQWLYYKVEKSLYGGLQIADSFLKDQVESLRTYRDALLQGSKETEALIDREENALAVFVRQQEEGGQFKTYPELAQQRDENMFEIAETLRRLEGLGPRAKVSVGGDQAILEQRFLGFIESGLLRKEDYETQIQPCLEKMFDAVRSLERHVQLKVELKLKGVHAFNREHSIIDDIRTQDLESLQRKLADIEAIAKKLGKEIESRGPLFRQWFGPRDGKEQLFGDQGRIWAWKDMLQDPWAYFKRRLLWGTMRLPGGKSIGLNLRAHFWGGKFGGKEIPGLSNKFLSKFGVQAKGLGDLQRQLLSKALKGAFRGLQKAASAAIRQLGSIFGGGGGAVVTTGTAVTGAAAPAATGGILAALGTSEFWVPVLAIGCLIVGLLLLLILLVVIIIIVAFKDFDGGFNIGPSGPPASAFVEVLKSTSVGVAPNDTETPVTYTVTITANDDIANLTASDEITMHSALGSVSLGSFASPTLPPTLAKGDSFSFDYPFLIPNNGSLNDSLIVNVLTLSVTTAGGDTVTTSGQASIMVGSPPAGLPPTLPPVAGGVCPPLGGYGDPRESCNPFGICTPYPHEGVDVAVPYKTPVKSPFPGEAVVVALGRSREGGIYLTLKSGEYEVTFRHLESNAVKKGDTVYPGQAVAFVNNTGTNTTGNHLHFEVRYKGSLVDPCSVGADTPCCP